MPTLTTEQLQALQRGESVGVSVTTGMSVDGLDASHTVTLRPPSAD